MNFAEAEAYLYSLGNEVSAMKLGLDAMRTLLSALDNPQKRYLKVQVAGTNGKGSVCAFLDSICNTAGIRTGTFTSPHLVSITERVRINGTDISEDEFARQASVVRDVSERLANEGLVESVPTFFEQVTAIALVAFADAGVEVGILETGLGGRLDATTAADAEIAAVTRIDLDHQEYLGDTIEEIAAEKAAIIHSGSRVVIGEQSREAMDVILRRCRELEIAVQGPCSLPVAFQSVELGLRGRHQIENAAITTAVLGVLKDRFSISKDDAATGLRKARHPGRLDYQGRYLFDGAHNPGGARALAEYLKEFERRPVTMIFGSMRDKDVTEIAALLSPLAKRIIFTVPDNSRAMKVDELAASFPTDIDAVLTQKVYEAIAAAEALAGDDGVILVTGSLYLVGEVKKLISDMKFEI